VTISTDTDDLVDTALWGEVITIVRNTPTYNDGGDFIDSWASVATPNGDIQPISGINPTIGIGQKRISSLKIFLPTGTDIKQGDRIRKSGWVTGDDEYEVDSVLDDEGHIECRLGSVIGHA